MKGIVAAGVLALTLVAAPSRAQQPTGKPPADSSAAAQLVRRAPVADPCADPLYMELRRMPLERMDDTQRRAFDELDRACADLRLEQARRRVGGGSMDPPVFHGVDYEHEVLPWLMGVAMFCTAVITFAKTMH